MSTQSPHTPPYTPQINTMTTEEDHEALILYHSYPYTYYVQSPSTTVSHANTNTNLTTTTTTAANNHNEVITRFTTLSRYSSSRGSNNSFSFTDVKKSGAIVEYDLRSGKSVENRLIIVDHDHHHRHGGGGGGDEEEDDDEDDFWWNNGKRRGCWWRYCSFRRSNSCAWISFQVFWRVLVSLGVALLVFYLATKPPPPKIAIKMAGIPRFVLGEGVDATGVTTKILTCNVSMKLQVENKSKLFGLHIHPPIMEISFGRLPFAFSHGPKLYAGAYDMKNFQLYVGTRNKPMYGAGRNMQDMLESGKGLPLLVRVSLKSHFRVVWNLIKPKFHHQSQCFLLLGTKYDKKLQTQAYKSSCTTS